MKYIISGNSKTVEKFIKERPSVYVNGSEGRSCIGEKLINCRTDKDIYRLEENDTIILLAGWWGRSWAKEAIMNAKLNFPKIKFEYHDGNFGEEQRKILESEITNGKVTNNRFRILDFSE